MAISFGISELPIDDDDDGAFLDGLAARGHTALELPFTKGFPWKEDRCTGFGRLAAERGIALSVHAPYFAMLTVADPDRYLKTRAAVEHSMKLGRRLGATVIVVHPGHDRDRTSDELLETALEALAAIEPKIRDLGLSLGLETTGTSNAFGTLGDIALMAAEFPWVRPVVDWAHVHATTDGRLIDLEAVRSVYRFLFDHFPSWKLAPLHTHYSHNAFGPGGEIKHIAYGEGSNPVEPVVEAATEYDVDLTIVSESRDDASHRAVWRDVQAATLTDGADNGRPALFRGDRIPRPGRHRHHCRRLSSHPPPPAAADHEPGQAVLPGRVHQGRSHPVLRLDRAGPPPPPLGPGHRHGPVPGRGRRRVLLREAGPFSQAGLDAGGADPF